MSIDYAAIDAAIFQRGATLGYTTFGVDDLSQRAATQPRAVLPWLVYKPLPVGGTSGGMRTVAASWWVYGSTTRAVRGIAAQLDALFGHQARFSVPSGRIAVTYIGQPFDDTALGLRGIELRLSYERRG